MVKENGEKRHWFVFSTITANYTVEEYEEIIYDSSCKNITKEHLDAVASCDLKYGKRRVVLSISYLGYMTKEYFYGKKEEKE